MTAAQEERGRDRGQALVEFSLAIAIFLALLIGVVDFGMAIYKYNGVSQAAREIARVASVHQGNLFFGVSPEITAVVATQQKLIPGLSSPTFSCQKLDGSNSPLVGNPPRCSTEDGFVKVTISTQYKPATPLVALVGTLTLTGSSSAQVQQ